MGSPPFCELDAGRAEALLVLPQGTQLAGVGWRIGAFFLAVPLSIVTLGIG